MKWDILKRQRLFSESVNCAWKGGTDRYLSNVSFAHKTLSSEDCQRGFRVLADGQSPITIAYFQFTLIISCHSFNSLWLCSSSFQSSTLRCLRGLSLFILCTLKTRQSINFPDGWSKMTKCTGFLSKASVNLANIKWRYVSLGLWDS